MGRAFEFRKARKMKRWGAMSKTFTKIGREISKAVKDAGPSPETNSRLRVIIQNAKAANMPKENVERAIKKASDKNTESWEERVYEGYALHGIAICIETLTDNPTRTVANVRAAFNKLGGALGTTGSLDFVFDRKCMFKVDASSINIDEFELEMIDFGADEIDKDDEENVIIIYGKFTDFGNIQAALEERGIEIKEEEVNKLIERLEDEDDVQQVFHTMA